VAAGEVVVAAGRVARCVLQRKAIFDVGLMLVWLIVGVERGTHTKHSQENKHYVAKLPGLDCR
jgi:hypothetical protein